MGQVIIGEHLAPPAVGQARTYAVDTRVEIQLPGHPLLAQASAARVRLVVHAAMASGYELELTTLALRPEAPTRPVELFTDIARHNSPLLVDTDAHGALQRVRNKPALAARWAGAGPALVARYADLPGAADLLGHVAGQYAAGTDHLEQALANKGPWAVLLPGLYGLHSWRGGTRTQALTVHQVLGGAAVPLLVDWTASPTPGGDVFAPALQVEGVGRLDRDRLDAAALAQFVDGLHGGVWRGPAAPLQVFWRAQYTVGRLGQGLLAGRVGLRLVVEGRYYADYDYTLRPDPDGPDAPPAPVFSPTFAPA